MQVVVSLLNWAAPAAFNAKMQRLQGKLLGAMTNSGTANFALVLLPVYAYQRGMVWRLESALQPQFAGCNVNIDRQMALVFNSQPDERDQRLLRMCVFGTLSR